MSERIMGAVTLGGSERLVPRNASGHDRTSGSVATSGEMTQINNRSERERFIRPAPARLHELYAYPAAGVYPLPG